MIKPTKFQTMRACPAYRDALRAWCDSLPTQYLVLVEIGSWIGESALIFAQQANITKVYCVDDWHETENGQIVEARRGVEAEFDRQTAGQPKIVKVKGRSPEIAKDWAEKHSPPDVVYIDAEKSEAAVGAHIDAWLKYEPLAIGGHDYHETRYPGVWEAVNARFGSVRTFADNSWLHVYP